MPQASPISTPQTLHAGAESPETRTFQIAPAESEVRYDVQEQFFGVQTPTRTIGRTRVITGSFELRLQKEQLTIASNGFIVDLRSLTTDDPERDESIRERWLESNQYPFARFTPSEMPDAPINPDEGREVTLQLLGDLTIRETTRPVTFTVRATLQGDTLTGSATTQILMRDFGFEPPNVLSVVQVQEGVTVTVDFAARDAAAPPIVAQATLAAPTPTHAIDQVNPIPADYRERFFHYTTVTRPDGTFRRMYINPEALDALRQDQPLPSGTIIIMESFSGADRRGGTLFSREKRAGWGADALSAIAADVRNGDWRYPSFATDDQRLLSADGASCHSCHTRAESPDYVFTMPDLLRAAQAGVTQQSACNRGGRQPCGP
jgi:polyisoprenoid-binding protein YceI